VTEASTALLVIVGPTGTGKSEVALEVAERIGGEIVGCDAIQVYRSLDAATAKPGPEARRRVPHHLVDYVDPRTDHSLADWLRDAERVVREIAERGHTPVVVGGTGMYLRGLLRGIVDAPARQVELRRRLYGMAARHGSRRLHRWLARRDPASALRLGPGDTQRIVRALELVLTGEPWSRRLAVQGTWARGVERYASCKLGLDLDRRTLHARLDARVDRFFENGLVEEVRALLRSGVHPSANAFKAIGYREAVSAIARGEDPAGVRAEVAAATRRYAKRQRTWFRGEPGVVWLDGARPSADVARDIETAWRAASAGRNRRGRVL
jgi:tRNA dimethylallyltransferase